MNYMSCLHCFCNQLITLKTEIVMPKNAEPYFYFKTPDIYLFSSSMVDGDIRTFIETKSHIYETNLEIILYTSKAITSYSPNPEKIQDLDTTTLIILLETWLKSSSLISVYCQGENITNLEDLFSCFTRQSNTLEENATFHDFVCDVRIEIPFRDIFIKFGLRTWGYTQNYKNTNTNLFDCLNCETNKHEHQVKYTWDTFKNARWHEEEKEKAKLLHA